MIKPVDLKPKVPMQTKQYTRIKNGISTYIYNKIPQKILNIMEDASEALVKGGLMVNAPKYVSGAKLNKQQQKDALNNRIFPLSDYAHEFAHHLASNRIKAEYFDEIMNIFETKPALVDWLITEKNADGSFRFTALDIINLAEAHTKNCELTEKLIEEKDEKGNFKYNRYKICQIVELVDCNPNIEEFARENPAKLYLTMKYYASRKEQIGQQEIDGVQSPIYKTKYTKEECGAILNAYCIDKKLFPKVLKLCDYNAFRAEDIIKMAKKDKHFARNLSLFINNYIRN